MIPGRRTPSYFKDGMRTVCHGKAWEEKGYVHCEYDGGILSYPAADVDRIVKGPTAPKEPEEPSPAPPAPRPRFRAHPPHPCRLPRPCRQNPAGSCSTTRAGPRNIGAAPTVNTTPTRKRSPPWPRSSTDRPSGSRKTWGTRTTWGSSGKPFPAAGSPRRPAQPMHRPTFPRGSNSTIRDGLKNTGPGPKPDTRATRRPSQALAREFNKTADWIERFMGDSNDLEQIRASLHAAQASKAE